MVSLKERIDKRREDKTRDERRREGSRKRREEILKLMRGITRSRG